VKGTTNHHNGPRTKSGLIYFNYRIAIRRGCPPFGEGFHADLLAPLELCAVYSPGFADKFAPITGLEDFARRPLIQDSHQLWYTLFEEAGIEVLGNRIPL